MQKEGYRTLYMSCPFSYFLGDMDYVLYNFIKPDQFTEISVMNTTLSETDRDIESIFAEDNVRRRTIVLFVLLLHLFHLNINFKSSKDA